MPVAELEQLKAQYAAAVRELEQGGVRPATLVGLVDTNLPGPKPRAQVVTPDGQQRFPFVHPDVSADQLEPGGTVFLDAKGAMVLGIGRLPPAAGTQATFVRRLPDSPHVEVSLRDEKFSFYASRRVLDAIASGSVKRGERLLICPQQQFAFDVIPADNDRRFRFVDSAKLPDVLPERDIGNPHPCLGWLVRRTRILMFRPDLRTKFEVRPRISLLMTGPSGAGKTLTIKAFLTLLRRMIAERTGRDDIGSRVIRVKMSEQLSEWLGRSDKNFEALFDDLQALAAEEIVTASGERIRVPVAAIFEEVEGLARRRSTGEPDGTGGAMDRILGTLLQRFDDPLDELAHLPLIILSTSNRPSMIDVAMHRRLGSKVARFRRLDRRGLSAVLSKKIKPTYPLAGNGTPAGRLLQGLIDEVTANLFDPQNDEVASLEITLGDGTKLTKFPRDFLTGSLVEQALSEAIDELTFFAEENEREEAGLDSAGLIDALRSQIHALVENVTPYNAADYIDLPDHTHVSNVRRLRRVNSRLNEVVVSEA